MASEKRIKLTEFVDLRGKTIVISGAFGIIGRAFCQYVNNLTPCLILIDHPSSYDESFVASLRLAGSQVHTFLVDFEVSDARKRTFAEISKAFKVIDVLINNAAFVGTTNLNGWSTEFESQSVDTWERALKVNLTTPFELIQVLYRNLKLSGCASIINIGSIYGELGPDWDLYEGTNMGNPAAYSASKGGLLQLTRWLATTLAPEIRVNSISPGGIKRNQPYKFEEKYNSRTPLRRMATVEEIVPAITFLASSDSKYITGQNLRIDGGWSIW